MKYAIRGLSFTFSASVVTLLVLGMISIKNPRSQNFESFLLTVLASATAITSHQESKRKEIYAKRITGCKSVIKIDFSKMSWDKLDEYIKQYISMNCSEIFSGELMNFMPQSFWKEGEASLSDPNETV